MRLSFSCSVFDLFLVLDHFPNHRYKPPAIAIGGLYKLVLHLCAVDDGPGHAGGLDGRFYAGSTGYEAINGPAKNSFRQLVPLS